MKKIIIFMSCVAALSSAAAQTETPGTLPGEFAINADGGKVQFSKGNLIYDQTTETFSFATSQSDYGSYFGWGTSGYHDPSDDLNTHYLPNDKTISYDASQTANTTGYGPSFVATDKGDKPRDLTWSKYDGSRYANYDWGVYNPITNGGNQAGLWRTLTQKEWLYLLEHTPHEWVQEGSVYGLQLTADDKEHTVFLPAAGYRGLNSKSTEGSGEPTMHEEGEHCNYWSATAVESYSLNAMTMNYSKSGGEVVSYNRFNGFSVRLVKDASSAWITLSDRVDNKELLEKYIEDGELANKPTNVHLGRSLYSDGWNTLCLPFDVTAEEVEATFGNCKLYTFSSAKLSDDKSELEISLIDAAEITAGTPYIIQPATDIINPDFYNRIIEVASGSGETTITGSTLQFVGILNPYQLTAGDKRYLFVTAGDELNWSKAGDTSSMYGMRAYFYVPDMEQATYAVAKRARLVIAPATHTPTDLNRLTDSPTPRFTKYIINGRLVLVKEGKAYDALGAEVER